MLAARWDQVLFFARAAHQQFDALLDKTGVELGEAEDALRRLLEREAQQMRP